MRSFVLCGGGPPSQPIRHNKNGLLTSLEVTQQFYSNELPRLPLDILTAYLRSFENPTVFQFPSEIQMCVAYPRGTFCDVRTSQSVLNTHLDSIASYTPTLYGIA